MTNIRKLHEGKLLQLKLSYIKLKENHQNKSLIPSFKLTSFIHISNFSLLIYG